MRQLSLAASDASDAAAAAAACQKLILLDGLSSSCLLFECSYLLR